MHWEDTAPRAAGVPANPTLFRVCILRVAEADPLPAAFAEFWRRVLTEGVAGCLGNWEVLLFAMNLLGGGLTGVFTDRALERDELPVFKLSAAAIEAECYALPEREPGDPRAEQEYRALEDRILDLLRQSAQTDPPAGLLRELRARRTFTIEVCDFYRTRRWEVGI